MEVLGPWKERVPTQRVHWVIVPARIHVEPGRCLVGPLVDGLLVFSRLPDVLGEVFAVVVRALIGAAEAIAGAVDAPRQPQRRSSRVLPEQQGADDDHCERDVPASGVESARG